MSFNITGVIGLPLLGMTTLLLMTYITHPFLKFNLGPAEILVNQGTSDLF